MPESAPAFLPGWSRLAHTERELGHMSDCLRAILRAADLSPDNAYMLATVGYSYINLNRIPDAVGPLQRAARFTPNDFLVQSPLGFCLEATGQTDAAIEHSEKAPSSRRPTRRFGNISVWPMPRKGATAMRSARSSARLSSCLTLSKPGNTWRQNIVRPAGRKTPNEPPPAPRS